MEDNEDNLRIFSTIFSSEGYEVVEARDGEAALRLARAARVDLVSLDVSLPGISGGDVLEELKGDPETARIPVLVVTAHALIHDREKAMRLGADAYLAKPVEPRKILAQIESMIGRNRPSPEVAGAAVTSDVFMCHNSADKAEVRRLADRLRSEGIYVWLDEDELRPGRLWKQDLEDGLLQINAAVVCIGQNGIGPWQRMEIDTMLHKFVERHSPVIPVLLKSAPTKPELPAFLSGITWVDLRSDWPDPIKQLVWGITGVREQ